MSQASDEEVCQQALDKLSEHFDSVQIFCTRHELGSDDGTVGLVRGQGNWYARIGQVKYWLCSIDERKRIEERDSDAD